MTSNLASVPVLVAIGFGIAFVYMLLVEKLIRRRQGLGPDGMPLPVLPVDSLGGPLLRAHPLTNAHFPGQVALDAAGAPSMTRVRLSAGDALRLADALSATPTKQSR